MEEYDAFAFEKLLVYQKSVDFADAVCDLTEQFPARHNRLADQVNRASLSIASNIAEGMAVSPSLTASTSLASLAGRSKNAFHSLS